MFRELRTDIIELQNLLFYNLRVIEIKKLPLTILICHIVYSHGPVDGSQFRSLVLIHPHFVGGYHVSIGNTSFSHFIFKNGVVYVTTSSNCMSHCSEKSVAIKAD